YRLQPYGVFALTYAYNDIHLPTPYNSASFWLIGPRTELSFSRSLFFSTFLQYNTQVNNVNINSRLQWRFRPVSDLFLVYTDNYFTDQFFQGPLVKNRALVLKMTYWLNL
ncbi:MAG TPA: hydrolase, partial [Haliscomenobacter sp.]|nr:hydrolase [Haliscomenobacter sp.]HPH19072.1 hydrolase [Haliscomenobacter sp.]